ncbi:phenylacetate-CoA oxygenase subunit PaaJ [Ornithinimicrobium sp. CNJ-824]|uniref:1,2-phenylacetyl-CoA epoxidase subunit PaaD n=1 Tax=Ornithinimicrobium sp. CNJ-824 TaxID=1904966 RepID=UPI000963B6F8|nr:1,2-phenylacetyl-CoA epoxidase subunit PaaD [Ornithinimicrobium sp. CNJ-824]OLT20193.1 phenylacetate-CoA oxygenase subunit PaaJ [Ornithinimicrobium sp. CNJ-824]
MTSRTGTGTGTGTARPDLDEVERAVRAVPDPEIPVITIDDLGVVREVERVDTPEGPGLRVTITPTYSGCPAMRVMEEDVVAAGRRAGVPVEVVTRLSPAWTTDWMSERGREQLLRFGIAPPTGQRAHGPVPVGLSVRQVACPRCGSTDTEEVARFGSTACKALRRCLACREPFDEFKTL